MLRKVNTKPTAIDLFAGAGGMTEGLRKAGFQSVLANEYDEMAGLTFQTNHPDVPLLVKDVKTLSVDEVLERTGLERAAVSARGVAQPAVYSTGDPSRMAAKGRPIAGDPPPLFLVTTFSTGDPPILSAFGPNPKG